MTSPLTLRRYQQEATRTDQSPGADLKSVMVPLLGLAGEAGSLLTEYKKYLREGDRYKPFTDQVAEELGDILWYVANIAEKAGLDLQDVAEENLAKLQERWPERDGGTPPLFSVTHDRYDVAYPEAERLPLHMRVEFREVSVGRKSKLQMTFEDRDLGDPLTDNAHTDDGYRYHDVFHLTNAVLLGWSPVMRKLLRVKRKSNARVDEVEDGARAAVTEEAISAVVFGYAKDYSYFESSSTVEYDLLRTIKLMAGPFEVRDRSLREWEENILKGYAVWRKMVRNQGGVFVGDAVARTVHYEPLGEPSK